ncbi:hypothetical protein ACI2IX_15105 [Leifsonia aquatica]|uniref:hypothetical protein n=1 Tax=Leifsonia aquatica TaxID=144185 RepID=UPI00384B6D09
MSDNTVTRVLILDDNPGRHSLVRSNESTSFRILHPLELEAADLEDIHLVCVDEYFDREWAADVFSLVGDRPALQNHDGLAVAAALRSSARVAAQGGQPGFAVALFTAELDKLAGDAAGPRQEPLTASIHDLEWIFTFDGGPSPLQDRFVELAEAVRSIARVFANQAGDSWLGLDTQAWGDLARAQIDDCRPPEHALGRSTGGLSYLRWFAQRILPYPTFLLDSSYAALLLGIEVAAFEGAEVQALVEQYDARYRGALSKSFLGTRWWRAALQTLLQDIGTSQWDSPAEKALAVGNAAGVDLVPLRSKNPVITYNTTGDVVEVDGEANDSVRVQMDGWPVYADEAWARLSDVRADASLRALVAHDDLERID